MSLGGFRSFHVLVNKNSKAASVIHTFYSISKQILEAR